METFRTLTRKDNQSELLLLILFIIYILFNIRTPYFLASFVDTVGGYLVVAGLFILLCKSVKIWLVAALGAIALIIFIQRSRVSTGTAGMSLFLPSEIQKSNYFSSLMTSDTPVTLEEEVVHKMAPFQDSIAVQGTYRPVLNDTHDAVKI
jgi:predicted membrane protein